MLYLRGGPDVKDLVREQKWATVLAVGFILVPFQFLYSYVRPSTVSVGAVLVALPVASGIAYFALVRRTWPPRFLWMIAAAIYVEMGLLLSQWLSWRLIVISCFAGVSAYTGWLVAWFICERRGRADHY